MISWTYKLRRGHSADPSEGACAMDAINWLVHGKHGDQPECACPVLGRYVIGLNDGMPDDQRQRLLAYLPRIAGSRSRQHETARINLLARGVVRVLLPIIFRASGLPDQAQKLHDLPSDVPMLQAAEAVKAAQVVAAKEAKMAAQMAEVAKTLKGMWTVQAGRMGAAVDMAVKTAHSHFAVVRGATWALEGMASDAATAAAEAAKMAGPVGWDAALDLLDAALRLGPEGEPWSATQIADGQAAYLAAGGRAAAPEPPVKQKPPGPFGRRRGQWLGRASTPDLYPSAASCARHKKSPSRVAPRRGPGSMVD